MKETGDVDATINEVVPVLRLNKPRHADSGELCKCVSSDWAHLRIYLYISTPAR